MEKLQEELHWLVVKLEKDIGTESKPASFVLVYLKRILQTIDRSGHGGSVGDIFFELRQYWLDSVPWCSELSKDIEKLMIMYDDLSADGEEPIPVSR